MAELQVGTDVRVDPTLDDLTSAQLLKIMPRCDVATWQPLLVSAMGRFGIVLPARVAGFLAQVAHESGECRRLEENLSYTAERLQQVWPTRFKTLAEAKPYERAPEALANHVYGSRNDLGNRGPGSGDGWRYRGGGLLQLTGRASYVAATAGTGQPLVEHPELLRAPGQAAADSAAWFWRSRGCNELADECRFDLDEIDVPFKALTKRINGGLVGLEERLRYWRTARAVLSA